MNVKRTEQLIGIYVKAFCVNVNVSVGCVTQRSVGNS